MNADEIIQLTQTLRLLRRFKGMPQFNWVDEIAERLGTSLKLADISLALNEAIVVVPNEMQV